MAKQACQVPTGTASKEVFAWAFDAEIAFCTRDSVLTVAFSSVAFRVAYVAGKVLKSSSSVATKLETPPTRAQTLKTKAEAPRRSRLHQRRQR